MRKTRGRGEGRVLYLDLGIRNGSRCWNMGINGQEKLRTGRRRNEELGNRKLRLAGECR